jgi:hypothetical protein
MRMALIAAGALFLVMTWPVQAQLFPANPGATAPPAPGTELVLADLTVWVNPPEEQGLCMKLDAGQVTVKVRRVSDALEQRPTTFQLYGFMADPDANVQTPISGQDVTVATRVTGAGHYCWHISVDAPEAKNMSMAQRGSFVQEIAVRISITP